MTDALKPCPFCGDTPTALSFAEGSTYRWLAWSCPSCCIGTEERMQTIGNGTPEQWLADAKARAVEAWNRRAAIAAQPGPQWHEAVARLVTGFEHVSGIARQWEPDYSSGADRAKWARATEACADVAKLLAAAPDAQKGAQP